MGPAWYHARVIYTEEEMRDYPCCKRLLSADSPSAPLSTHNIATMCYTLLVTIGYAIQF